MIKTVASIFLFFLRFFGVAVLILLPDLLVFASFSVQQGLVLSGKILAERVLYAYAATAPVILFFSLTAGNVRAWKKSFSEKTAEAGLSAIVSVFSLLLFLRCASSVSDGNLPLLSDYCLAGTAVDFSFPESFGIPFFHGFAAESVILFPFCAFSPEWLRLIGINEAVFLICGITPFFLAVVCVRFCCGSRWPLFNLSVSLFALYFCASVNRLWLFATDRFALSPTVFVVGVTAVNLLPAVGMSVLIWRRSRDSLF